MWITSSTRKTPGAGVNVSASSLFVGLLIAIAGGCSTQQKVVYAPVNTKPIVGDDAMALRSDWPKSVAHYQNGAVAAWSTRFPYETQAMRPEWQNLVIEPVMFVAQTAALPVELVANPPFQPQVWYGVEIPPTYTAQPPLLPPGGMTSLKGSLYGARAMGTGGAGQ